MTQHIELTHGQILHAGFTSPIQELLSGAAFNFQLVRVNGTTIKIAPGPGDEQAGVSIGGKYRYRSTETTAALPGSLPNGSHPIFVTATANNFTGPIEEPDLTTHTFGLEIKKSGETPSAPLYRKVGEVTVTSESITGLRQTLNMVTGAQIEANALTTSGSITWERSSAGAWLPQIQDGGVTSRMLRPTAGVYVAGAGSDVPLNAGTYENVGTALEVTPVVASKLLITATFEFWINSGGASEFCELLGTIKVDAETEQTGTARAVSAGVAPLRVTCAQSYAVSLSAATHKIQMRARRPKPSKEGGYNDLNTRMNWMLVAA